MNSEASEREARARELMMAALDGELSAGERHQLDQLLADDAKLRSEWEQLSKLKEVTHAMDYRKPPEETWDRYFESVYNRLERGAGWALVSFGAIVLAGFGLWSFVQTLLADTDLPGLVKIAVFAVLLGGAVLLLSVLRERVFTRKTDPYKEIQR